MCPKRLTLLVASCFVSFFLAACGTKGRVEVTDIVMEPDAKESGTKLTPEELSAFRTEGEIDKDLPSTALSDVAKEYKSYLHNRRKHTTASIKRCQLYLPYAKGIFEDKGMPQDLAYLAIVESGYDTTANSRSGAAGTWQFMKKTGKAYGLKQDTWTDDRYDFYEATEAAATYLKKLHKDFRDWPTAIAAYNSGEGKMRRALEGSGSKNFFEVRERNDALPEKLQLREETKQYVPKFLALVKIMRNLKELGLPTIREDKALQVERLVAQPATDLKAVAKGLSMNWNDFFMLNAHQKAPVTSASRETYIYVPSEKAELAKKVLAESKSAYADWTTCTIEEPMSWQTLEKRYRISGEKLKTMNPCCSLKTGDVVLVPGNVAQVAVASKNVKKAGRGQKTHVLQPQETLYGVAKMYSVSPIDLMKANGIQNPRNLASGMRLRIPGTEVASNGPAKGSSYGSIGSSQASQKKKNSTVYVVQNKDTMWKIARQFNVSIEDLKRMNSVDEHSLRVGTRLIVNAE